MALRKKTSVSLSEQNILDCAKLFCYGCGGGSPAYAYLYIYSNKGRNNERHVKLSCHSRFQSALPFENATTCSKRTLKTTVVTQLNLQSV